MKKLDAFARTVKYEHYQHKQRMAELLRRHHAKIERLVRRLRQQCIDDGKADGSVEGLGYWHVKEDACTDLLAALKELRR